MLCKEATYSCTVMRNKKAKPRCKQLKWLATKPLTLSVPEELRDVQVFLHVYPTDCGKKIGLCAESYELAPRPGRRLFGYIVREGREIQVHLATSFEIEKALAKKCKCEKLITGGGDRKIRSKLYFVCRKPRCWYIAVTPEFLVKQQRSDAMRHQETNVLRFNTVTTLPDDILMQSPPQSTCAVEWAFNHHHVEHPVPSIPRITNLPRQPPPPPVRPVYNIPAPIVIHNQLSIPFGEEPAFWGAADDADQDHSDSDPLVGMKDYHDSPSYTDYELFSGVDPEEFEG